MRTSLRNWYTSLPSGAEAMVAFLILCILSVWGAIVSGYYVLAGLPVGVLVVFLALADFKQLYWLLLAMIPFSTEIVLPNGFGTDLPTEPIMMGLMVIFGIFMLRKLPELSFDSWRHPVMLALLLHLSWTLVTTIMSDLLFVSVKFSLAKLWYVFSFFLLTFYLLREEADFRRFFWVFFIPYALVAGIIFTRHALGGFDFMDIHSVMHPFHRNHVNYAASLSLFYPFIVLMLPSVRRYGKRWWVLAGSLVFLLAAIYFSYTRAAYAALLIAGGAYFVIRWRLVKPVLILASLGAIIGLAYFVRDNTYLEYAPNFEKTISHEKFDNLLEATYKMEDISTMERVYRWVAAGHMAPERPVLGWGPGNFVNFYEHFTVTSFQTYVSNNPERSGVHSYFFMLLVEQGIPGLLFFLALLFAFLLQGERLYHQLAPHPFQQRLLMSAMLSMIVITAFLLINDLVETDKVGSFFFINLALMVRLDRWWRAQQV